jgi:hypothetical protein
VTPYLFSILTLILGAFGSLFLNNYIRRAKLVVTGSGSGDGGAPENNGNYVMIENAPGLLGVNLGETNIFGMRVLPPIRWGLPIERYPARECRASIHELPSRRYIRPLWWQVEGKAVQAINLDTNESAMLRVFATRRDEPLKYFVYEPEGGASLAPNIPDDSVKWHEDRAFLIRVNYSRGQTLNARITVRKEYDGRLRYECAGGSAGL